MEQVSEQLAMELAVKVANTRTAWTCTIGLLLEHGLVSPHEVLSIRERLLHGARKFAASPSARKSAFGIAAVKDVESLFRGVVAP